MPANIKRISGLPIKLTSRGLIFSKSLSHPFFEKKDYKKYREFFKSRGLAKNKVLYYIYRNVAFLKDAPLFKKEGLRYDLTLIFPGKIGKEAARTVGHVHKLISKKKSIEEYQVISGKALFILQNIKNGRTFTIPRKAGQKVLFAPEEFGHIAVNASYRNPLLVANITSNKKNISDYSLFKKHHGSCWYPIFKGNKIVFEKNLSYKNPQKPEKIIPKKLILKETGSLYKDFVKNPRKFRSLEV